MVQAAGRRIGGGAGRGLALLALVLAAAPAPAAQPAPAQVAAAERPEVATRTGRVRGTVVDGVAVFKGVRYGASTAGRRFQPPRPPEPWPGAVDATDYANQSPQVAGGPNKLFASWPNPRTQSDDCLFLNVWTRGAGDAKRRPVMVWFHGGGFSTGSGASNGYDGVRLAQRGDVVVVTVNHRLNAFGYLYLAGLSRDPALADSGNVGSLDMIQSLRWVRDNIARFGGDPDNVTIFGESGGGGKVTTLMSMPSARGLFHKAAVQSSSTSVLGYTPAQATANARAVLAAAGVTPDRLGELNTMPVDRLVAALGSRPGLGGAFRPVVDGRYMPRQPFDPDAPPAGRDVPLLIGTNATETTLLLGIRDPSAFAIGWDELPRRLAPYLAGTDAPAAIASLRRLYPGATASDLFFRATTLRQYRKTAITVAERKAAQGGAPVWMYLLDWRTPVDGGKWGTPHALEIAFVFDNVAKSASIAGAGAEQQRLADLMSDAWIAFARTGNPQTAALPEWRPYDPVRRSTMIFNTRPRLQDDPEAEQRKLFAALPVGRVD